MKKLILITTLTAAMALGGTGLYAQGWGGGWGYHHGGMGYGMGFGNMGYLQDELKLTDKQVEQIIKIDADYRVKFHQNRDNYDKIVALRQEHRKAIYNVFTDEQKKKFDANYKNRRGGGYCWKW
jgi:Spy/CpxP family protein refolding chaperone